MNEIVRRPGPGSSRPRRHAARACGPVANVAGMRGFFAGRVSRSLDRDTILIRGAGRRDGPRPRTLLQRRHDLSASRTLKY